MTEARPGTKDLELEEAVAAILAAMPPPVGESVGLAEAHGRVLTEPVGSPGDLPRFDNSAVDGYAVLAKDTGSASPEAPARLTLVGTVAAGKIFQGELAAGACVRIATGAALPRGADAVVMQESTATETSSTKILIFEAVKPWENVRLRGEDVKAGSALVGAGEVLTSGQIGLLAGAGVARVSVGCQPQAGLLATGSELQEPGQPLAPGEIYESNRLALAPLVRKCGGIPRIFPLVADELESTQAALEEAFNLCDVVVTTGGASVGELDFVKRALVESGGEVRFWRVAIKPGRPFFFGRWRNITSESSHSRAQHGETLEVPGAARAESRGRREKFLFGLPGNPVSAFVTFLLLVRPALLRWQGAGAVSLPVHAGVLAERLSNPDRRRHFVRVRMGAHGKVSAAGLQASHALSSLGAVNGLVDVPPGASLPAGTSIGMLSWE